MKNIIIIAFFLLPFMAGAQTRNQSTMNARKASIDTTAIRKAYIGGTLTNIGQADSELTVQHGAHLRGGLKVEGKINGVAIPVIPFTWSVTGGSAVQDSLRFIAGAGIVQTRNGNAVTTTFDSGSSIKSTGLLVKGKSTTTGLVVTSSDINTNTSTTAQASDSSAAALSFTGTGKPMFSMTGVGGGNIVAIDSFGNIGIGVSKTYTNNTKLEGVSDGIGSTLVLRGFAPNGGTGSIFLGAMARGSLLQPQAVQQNDEITSLRGMAYNGSTFTGSKATLDIVADENWNLTSNGTAMRIRLTGNTSTSLTEVFRINNLGNIITMPGKFIQYGGINLKGLGMPIIIDTIERGFQALSINSTNINNSSTNGLYSIHYYLSCSNSDQSNSSVYLNLSWNDGTSIKNKFSQTLFLNSTNNEVDGEAIIKNSSGYVIYSTTVSGNPINAKYLLCINCERIY